MVVTDLVGGQAVVLSEAGLHRISRQRDKRAARVGYIVGQSRDGAAFYVLWDGLSRRQVWRHEYLRPVEWQ